MRGLMIMPVLAGAMMLAGCDARSSEEAGGSDLSQAGNEKLQPAGDSWSAVKLTGLTCGDNCYVQIEPAAGGAAQEVMCTAQACNPWFEEQALPADIVGKTYEVRLGTAEQVDNAGIVQDAGFPAIVEMRPAG